MQQLTLSDLPFRTRQLDTAYPDGKCPEANEGKDPKGEWFPAKVPGAIHYDLVAQKKLENPFRSTKAAFDAAWVARSDWVYHCKFESPPDYDKKQTILLRCTSIDTYGEVFLNGRLLGETANAYRVYDFTVDPSLLRPKGTNDLVIRIKAHERMIAGKIDETERHLQNGRSPEGTLGKSLIRRYQRSFYAGSSLLNLGTGVLGLGIIREISLVMYEGPYLEDLCFKTQSIGSDQARCKILLAVRNAGAATMAHISLHNRGGAQVCAMDIPLPAQKNLIEREVPLTIQDPETWWPRGYGEPHLYTLKVRIEEGGRISDELSQDIGIKTVELVKKDERGRNTFYFKINGRKVIIHGQNHVPLDYIKSYGEPEAYQQLFMLLENQHVNMVRIWGGGMVEDESYYRECDRRGIMIWSDFFLHSNQYPDYDPVWRKEFLAESEEMLKVIRRHPCLVILCGGNETLEGWEGWGWPQATKVFNGERLIMKDLPLISERLCPELPYIINSPHGGLNCQSPVEGESHNWGNFYNATKDPTFVTETCWTQESYSRPETLLEHMDLDVDSFKGQNWAVKWRERTSLGLFTKYPYSDWFETRNLRLYLRSLEIEQLRADYSALGLFRFECPNNNGVLYWSFTKGGPLFQFGCVDYSGRPLMSYYGVKRVFAPLAVKARRDLNDISVLLSKHSPGAVQADLEVFHLRNDGSPLGYWSRRIRAEEGDLEEVFRLKDLYGEVEDRTAEVIHVSASVKGEVVSDDMLFFCAYREYVQEAHALRAKTERAGPNRWLIHLEADAPIRMVELESKQKLLYSDNYFPMIGGMPKTIEAVLLEPKAKQALQLQVGVLGDGEGKLITLPLTRD